MREGVRYVSDVRNVSRIRGVGAEVVHIAEGVRSAADTAARRGDARGRAGGPAPTHAGRRGEGCRGSGIRPPSCQPRRIANGMVEVSMSGSLS